MEELDRIKEQKAAMELRNEELANKVIKLTEEDDKSDERNKFEEEYEALEGKYAYL
jgi:hypothetical protein